MDTSLRDLERKALSGAILDKATYLHALVHAGIYTSREIEAMAWLGLPAARVLFPSPKRLPKGNEKKISYRRLFSVEEFESEFLQPSNPKWIDLEDQVIDRLSRQHGIQLAFALFERFLLPKAFLLDRSLDIGLGNTIEKYLAFAKRYQGLSETGPRLYKHQFEALRTALRRAVQDCPNSIEKRMAAELPPALLLDHQNYAPRRIFYFVVHAIARINDIEISYPDFRQPETGHYKQLIVLAIRDFLVPPAVR